MIYLELLMKTWIIHKSDHNTLEEEIFASAHVLMGKGMFEKCTPALWEAEERGKV